MLQSLAFLGALVALSSACCTPDQWEGGQGSTIGYSGYKKGGLIREYRQVSYDYTNKRAAVTLYYFNEGIKGEYKIVIRYDDDYKANCNGTCHKGRMYLEDIKTGKCFIKPLLKPFRKACVPDAAKDMGEFFVGLKGGLDAEGFEYDGKDFSASITVSKPQGGVCIPVGEVVASRKGRYALLSTVGFVNISAGIKDPSVFDIPEACQDNGYFPEELLTMEDHFFAL